MSDAKAYFDRYPDRRAAVAEAHFRHLLDDDGNVRDLTGQERLLKKVSELSREWPEYRAVIQRRSPELAQSLGINTPTMEKALRPVEGRVKAIVGNEVRIERADNHQLWIVSADKQPVPLKDNQRVLLSFNGAGQPKVMPLPARDLEPSRSLER